nr:hypothetical protein [Streptococcus pneumoniae]
MALWRQAGSNTMVHGTTSTLMVIWRQDGSNTMVHGTTSTLMVIWRQDGLGERWRYLVLS